jgi:cytochrome c oxidase accessory protein FixG
MAMESKSATQQPARRAEPSLDSVTTIGDDGSRRFVHPATVVGRFTRARALAGLLILALYIALPWIRINGHPAVFLDVMNRQFHLFGITFGLQDLWLGFFAITGLGFALFYLTALLGRVWCGWACPQTVFLDVVRRIERWFEGDATARRKLDAQPWTAAKTLRRGGSQVAFLLFAFVVAHVFLSYFVALPQLYEMMTHSPREHWASFVFMAAVTAGLWFNFSWFREQFCIILCPYGRIQSALTDDDTMVIGYDEKRGEPRGKKGTAGAGDCVDCRRCVQVCPTGIDIRHGLQLECIGCAACVDACDAVMEKVGRARGLVRFDSLNGLQRKPRRILRPRIVMYTAFLVAGMGALALALGSVKAVNITTTRLSGAAFFLDGPRMDSIRNQFLVRVLNKRNDAADFTLRFSNAPEGLNVSGVGEKLHVAGQGSESLMVVLRMPVADFHGEFPLELQVLNAEGAQVANRTLSFLGPKK